MARPDGNGRQLKRGDPLIEAIMARQREYRDRGDKYPEMAVEHLYDQPCVWFGRLAFHAETLDRLSIARQYRNQPVPLPDHFVLDGDARLPTESRENHEKYLVYRDLGPSRTLTAARKQIEGEQVSGKRGDNLRVTASRYRWDERVAAWDGQMEVEARRALAAMAQEQMQVEISRRKTYLDNEWAVVEKGYEVLQEMLKYPVVEKKYVSPDGKTTIWQPGKWTYAAMAQLMDTLAKMGRLHTGLSTSNTASKIEATVHSDDKPAMSAEEAEMEAYATAKAEDAYFAAIDEWKAKRAGNVLTARVDEAAD